MRLGALVNCAACLRATRQWSLVTVTDAGATVVSVQLCAACRTNVIDAARRVVAETRREAVRL